MYLRILFDNIITTLVFRQVVDVEEIRNISAGSIFATVFRIVI